MKIQTSKADLLQKVSKVHIAGSETRTSGIALKAENHLLKMMGTDNSIAVYCWHPSEVLQEGYAIVPAKLFCDLVKELPEGKVVFEAKDDHMIVTAGLAGEFLMRLPLLSDGQWIEMPKHEVDKNRAKIKALSLAYILEQVFFCIGIDKSRAYGNVGFLHRPKQNTLRAVGTDGYRLSFCEGSFELPLDFLPNGICLSKKALGEILRLCLDGYEEIELAISKDQTTLCASVADCEIYVALSNVTYPKYETILPNEEGQFNVGIAKPLMQTVSKRVMLAAGKSRTLQVKLGARQLTLKAKSVSNNVEGVEAIKLPDYQGPDLNLSINGKYLSDILNTIQSENCKINFVSEENPVILAPDKEPLGCKSLHVLVPIRELEG